MNRKQRNAGKLRLRSEGHIFRRCYPAWQVAPDPKETRDISPVTIARKRGKNRQLARYYFDIRSKRHARRLVEVSL